jgi:hypothetical protein
MRLFPLPSDLSRWRGLPSSSWADSSLDNARAELAW